MFPIEQATCIQFSSELKNLPATSLAAPGSTALSDWNEFQNTLDWTISFLSLPLMSLLQGHFLFSCLETRSSFAANMPLLAR